MTNRIHYCDKEDEDDKVVTLLSLTVETQWSYIYFNVNYMLHGIYVHVLYVKFKINKSNK